jgi:hypothetical protein
VPMIWSVNETLVKPWVKNFSINIDVGWYRILDMYVTKH